VKSVKEETEEDGSFEMIDPVLAGFDPEDEFLS
jgi:hypothetical protein